MLGLVVYEPPQPDIIDFPPLFTVHVPRVVDAKHLIKYSWPSIGEDGSVATSGVAGRYLYRQIPHSSAGDELTLAEVEKLDQELAAKKPRQRPQRQR